VLREQRRIFFLLPAILLLFAARATPRRSDA
jgi:hypothetical protein